MVRFMRLKRYARLSFVLVIPKILKIQERRVR